MENLSKAAEQILTERFGRDALIALATEEDGVPYVRNVDAYYENGAFYVITSRLSNKMRQIGKNPVVAVAGEWFTAHGRAEDLGCVGKEENAGIMEKLCSVFSEWIDNGHTDLGDGNTCLLCVRLTEGVLFSHGVRYDICFDK